VGHGIEKGKLSADIRYLLSRTQLSAENKLVLDHRPSATRSTPPARRTCRSVSLVVALLKDRNGVIDINLPISGSLDYSSSASVA
jgi:hypothetical protein